MDVVCLPKASQGKKLIQGHHIILRHKVQEKKQHSLLRTETTVRSAYLDIRDNEILFLGTFFESQRYILELQGVIYQKQIEDLQFHVLFV